MFLFFIGALAVTIVIPSVGYKVEVGLLAGGAVTILSTAAVLYTYSAMPMWKKHPNPLIFYRSLFDMGFVLFLMTTQLYKCYNGNCVVDVDLSPQVNQALRAEMLDMPKRELHQTPQGGTASTTATTSTTLFVDYCPATFARIRAFYGISTDAYVKSLMKTTKERLIVKSMSEGEASFLQSIAADYAAFLLSHPESLLTRFFGCHSVHLNGTMFHFVVMSNQRCLGFSFRFRCAEK
ncbi:hypothetical protein H310_11396 [Aphanomyces invadans]|uniref:PIPK domain-containing protein n=1 Tax=Aphanomyces invadans TaxID=157072 RepID=A0A024TP38_9STRA|nr:hypothetical protein H310_11396 [Aphanomyces invadans]ETV95127.1 hypothetical protein H310_11396 [Aphanomyces invadans]|eukprot:XP_008876300.1 hypothetical protein H310_11396 [Aphanomyces invadans]